MPKPARIAAKNRTGGGIGAPAAGAASATFPMKRVYFFAGSSLAAHPPMRMAPLDLLASLGMIIKSDQGHHSAPDLS
jgi:hypothetical protein